MTTTKEILNRVKNTITSSEERAYFLIHSVRYNYILEQIILISRGRKLRILDIGCFPYHIGKALELLDYEVYGIASSHEPIKNKRVEILNIEKDPFPFEDNFFDLVLCNEVIEHLSQSPMSLLKEIKRVLKKNGTCMITTPNIVRSINRVKMLLGKTIMYPISVYLENHGKGNNIYHRHNREYVLLELVFLLSSLGFVIEKKGFFVSYTPFRKRPKGPDKLPIFLGKLYNYFLMLCYPSLRDTLIILGKK